MSSKTPCGLAMHRVEYLYLVVDINDTRQKEHRIYCGKPNGQSGNYTGFSAPRLQWRRLERKCLNLIC
jgi:hypothetical protein